MLTHKVKVNAVDNLSDARYCAGMFVDFIGFSLKDGQNEWIDVSKIKEMTNWLAGVTLIGEVHENNWPSNAADYPFQIWETAELDLFLEKKVQGFSLGFRLDATDPSFDEKLNKVLNASEYIRIDNASPELIDELEKLQEVVFIHLTEPLIMGKIWEKYPLLQVTIDSGKEVRPGQSDFGSLMDVLEALDA